MKYEEYIGDLLEKMLLLVVGQFVCPDLSVLPSSEEGRAGSGGKRSERDSGAASIKRGKPAKAGKTERPGSLLPELPPSSVTNSDSAAGGFKAQKAAAGGKTQFFARLRASFTQARMKSPLASV